MKLLPLFAVLALVPSTLAAQAAPAQPPAARPAANGLSASMTTRMPSFRMWKVLASSFWRCWKRRSGLMSVFGSAFTPRFSAA